MAAAHEVWCLPPVRASTALARRPAPRQAADRGVLPFLSFPALLFVVLPFFFQMYRHSNGSNAQMQLTAFAALP